MFTGIIQATGKVISLQRKGNDARLKFATGKLDLSDTVVGDSIAVNGVCLTAVSLGGENFEADVSAESLSRTTLGALATGSPVNLELAMRADTRFGGHIVSGHVDGIGSVVDVSVVGESLSIKVKVANELACYIAEKGSVTIDGVSLTVNTVEGDIFAVNIVPHTRQETIISHYKKGSKVNIEVDIIARYLERLLLCDKKGLEKNTGDRSLLNKIKDMFEG